MRLQRIHLEHQRMHQAGVGIDVEELKEPRKHGRNVGVHQLEQPEPDKEQQCSLEQLEHRDGHYPGMVPARTSHDGKYLYHRWLEGRRWMAASCSAMGGTAARCHCGGTVRFHDSLKQWLHVHPYPSASTRETHGATALSCYLKYR